MEAAISLLKPLVQLADGPLNGEDRGIAWAVLARTYQDIGSFDQARRCYEEALQILASAEGAASQYASALDNFGSLYREEKQFAAADELRHRALAFYQHLSDHARAAIVLNNLAATAIEQNNQRRGREYLRRAFEETQHATDIGSDDLAAIYSNQGTLFLLAGNPYRAQQDFQMSMALWQRAFGPNHYWIGWGYILRAQCYLAEGNNAGAGADVEKGMAILEKTLGRGSRKYALAEMVYARTLNASGDEARAHSVESAAQRSLRALERGECGGCSVSAEAFR